MGINLMCRYQVKARVHQAAWSRLPRQITRATFSMAESKHIYKQTRTVQLS